MVICRTVEAIQQTWGGMMTVPSTSEVTRLLPAWSAGDETALPKLIPLIYLRQLTTRPR